MKMVIFFLAIAVIVSISAFLLISSFHFNRMIHKETEQLLNHQETDSLELFNYGKLNNLPRPVRRYLQNAVPDGYPLIRTVALHHTGYFRTEIDQNWWAIEGEEYFRVTHPSYIWVGKISPYSAIWLKVRDKYLDGRGEVLVRMFSAFTVNKTADAEVNQSALIRFAGELPWFPTALLPSKFLRWEAIDDHSARAIITDQGITVSVVYYFNEENQITRFFTQDRYYKHQKRDFTGYYRQYEEINGVKLPTMLEAEWNLPEGNFSYARFKLTDIIYNKSETTYQIETHPLAVH